MSEHQQLLESINTKLAEIATLLREPREITITINSTGDTRTLADEVERELARRLRSQSVCHSTVGVY